MIPEVIIIAILNSSLKLIREDCIEYADDPTKMYLYEILNNCKIGTYDFFEQAKELFLRDEKDPRSIKTRLFFDTSRAQLPTFHINLPSEQGSAHDGIGVDEGYGENTFNDENEEVGIKYSRSFRSSYNIIATSDNVFEVVIMYTVLKHKLISMFDILELNGLRNPSISGGDIQPNSELVPMNVFFRSISLSFSYDICTTRHFKEKLIKDLNFKGELIDGKVII